MEWYTAPGDVVLDPNAGTCPLMLACIRLGRVGICIELDSDKTGILAKAKRRAKMYWMFLKHEGLLRGVGEAPAPPTDWERFGASWQSMYAGFAGLKKPRWARPKTATVDMKRRKLLKGAPVVKLSKDDGLPVEYPRVNFLATELDDLVAKDAESGTVVDLTGEFEHVGRGVVAARALAPKDLIFPNRGKFTVDLKEDSNRAVYVTGSKSTQGVCIYLVSEKDCAFALVNDGTRGVYAQNPVVNVKVVMGEESSYDTHRCMMEVTQPIKKGGFWRHVHKPHMFCAYV